MSSSHLSQSPCRLLALLVLLSGFIVWGAADRLSQGSDQHFQAAGMEESLSYIAHGDDSPSDPPPDAAPAKWPWSLLPTGQHTPCVECDIPGARLLSGPGLPRAPPA
ncbi:hypothetical protein [Marinobacter sp. OP 3.4]|uniref:hypothetical protein n=1 Tax=Marinobacter sp. OP 3.4 TaxID=3076501 RepID=UPI002E1BB7B1